MRHCCAHVPGRRRRAGGEQLTTGDKTTTWRTQSLRTQAGRPETIDERFALAAGCWRPPIGFQARACVVVDEKS